MANSRSSSRISFIPRSNSDVSLPDIFLSPEIDVSSFAKFPTPPSSRNDSPVDRRRNQERSVSRGRSRHVGPSRDSAAAESSSPSIKRSSYNGKRERSRGGSSTGTMTRKALPSKSVEQKTTRSSDSDIAGKLEGFEIAEDRTASPGSSRPTPRPPAKSSIKIPRLFKHNSNNTRQPQVCETLPTIPGTPTTSQTTSRMTSHSSSNTFSTPRWTSGSSTPPIRSRDPSPFSKDATPLNVRLSEYFPPPPSQALPPTPPQSDYHTAPSTPESNATTTPSSLPHLPQFPSLPAFPPRPPITRAPTLSTVPQLHATTIQLSSGAVLTLIPPLINPWGFTTYKHGPIRVTRDPLAALRKDSIATTVALWEDEKTRVGGEVAAFGGPLGGEKAVMEGVVGFFVGWLGEGVLVN